MTKFTVQRALLFIFLSVVLMIPTQAQNANDLFISEYVEGSHKNKAIEIANFTGQDVDLTHYTFNVTKNGSAWKTPKSLTKDGMTTLPNGKVLVIFNADITDKTFTTKTEFWLQLTKNSQYVTFNGDDAIGLFKDGNLIDVIGIENEDPGSGWAVAGTIQGTKNHTLIRKPTIAKGNTNWANSAGENADDSEWIVNDSDHLSNLGEHTFTQTAPPAEKKDQKIIFTLPSGKKIGDSFSLEEYSRDKQQNTPTTLKIVYTSSNTAVATVAGNTVTIVGAGATDITGTQEGNDEYNPATPVTHTLTIKKANQEIDFPDFPTTAKTFGDDPFDLKAKSLKQGTFQGTGLTVTYESSNTNVAQIIEESGVKKVKIVGVGTSKITASCAGNDEYNPAEPLTKTLEVNMPTGSDYKLGFLINESTQKPIALTQAPQDSSERVTDEKQTFKFAGKVLDIKYNGTATVTLAIPYNENLPEETVNRLEFFHRDPITKAWERIGITRLDRETHIAYLEGLDKDSFSFWVLGVSTIPPIPLSNYPLIALFVVIGVFVFIKFRK